MANPIDSIVPQLRFSEFRSRGGWGELTLGDHGEFLSSLTGKASEQFGIGSAMYVTYMNVFGNAFTDLSSLGAVDVADDERQNRIAAGDVLFTVSSETPEEAGMSSVVLATVPNCYLNSFCTLFRFRSESRPNLHFAGYAFRQPRLRQFFALRAQGSTRFNLSKSVFRIATVAVPFPDEQQKIADCLTSLDEVITAQAQKVEALKTYKRGLMQQLFPREGETVPRLRFQQHLRGLPWKRRRLSELSRRGSGHTPSRSVAEYYNGGIKWVSLADSARLDNGLISATSTEISELGVAHSSAVLHDAGSVILCRDAGIGKCAVMAEQMAVSQHFLVWTCNGSLLSNWFLYYRFQTMRSKFEQVASGSTIKTIGLPFFDGLSIEVPELEEQKLIAESLLSLDVQLTTEVERLATLKHHKAGLVQRLFPAPEIAVA